MHLWQKESVAPLFVVSKWKSTQLRNNQNQLKSENAVWGQRSETSRVANVPCSGVVCLRWSPQMTQGRRRQLCVPSNCHGNACEEEFLEHGKSINSDMYSGVENLSNR